MNGYKESMMKKNYITLKISIEVNCGRENLYLDQFSEEISQKTLSLSQEF